MSYAERLLRERLYRHAMTLGMSPALAAQHVEQGVRSSTPTPSALAVLQDDVAYLKEAYACVYEHLAVLNNERELRLSAQGAVPEGRNV